VLTTSSTCLRSYTLVLQTAVTSHHPIRKVVPPEPTVIPDKLYFRIGDVAKLCDVPTYVLRFWETEFPQLKPNKGGTGQRLYRKRDVEMALRIKTLLYDQGYTIPGARQVFATESKAPESRLTESKLADSRTKDAPEPAAPLASSAPPSQPAPSVDMGETIRREAQRREQISSLRTQLRSLADLLTPPASPPRLTPAAAETAPAVAPAATIQSLRPRLVLEPRPETKPDATPDAKPAPRLLDQSDDQRDLFPSE
jgi:DNA-binding transcriptional MerR regulator